MLRGVMVECTRLRSCSRVAPSTRRRSSPPLSPQGPRAREMVDSSHPKMLVFLRNLAMLKAKQFDLLEGSSARSSRDFDQNEGVKQEETFGATQKSTELLKGRGKLSEANELEREWNWSGNRLHKTQNKMEQWEVYPRISAG